LEKIDFLEAELKKLKDEKSKLEMLSDDEEDGENSGIH